MKARNVRSIARATMRGTTVVFLVSILSGCKQSPPLPAEPPVSTGLPAAELEKLSRLGESFATNAAVIDRAVTNGGVILERDRTVYWANLLEQESIENEIESYTRANVTQMRSYCESVELWVLPSYMKWDDAWDRLLDGGGSLSSLMRKAAPSKAVFRDYVGRTSDKVHMDITGFWSVCESFGFIESED